MKRYLEYYENEWPENIEELTAIENKPFVGYLNRGGVKYTVIPKPVVYDPYVTFTAQEDNSSIGLEKLSTNQTLEYSADTTTWNTFDTTTNISLNNGDKVYVRGILSTDNTDSNYTNFKMSGKIAASGNCNALWNYEDLNAPLKQYCGYYMFRLCTSLTDAPELPATALAEYCYAWMFGGCTVTKAPELPATTLARSCYEYMFNSCTSLITAPELPGTELAEECYHNMFRYCTSLIDAPELPATTLAKGCYNYMFDNCTSLTTAPELPATELAEDCYECMFVNCTGLTKAPKLPATTLAKNCYSCMFEDCTSLTDAPELSATELTEHCYESMFGNCTSLIAAPELPASKLAAYCYAWMFRGCTSLNYIKCLATDVTGNGCVSWVSGVSSTGTFVKHPVANWSTGTSGIPSGWTVVDAVL